MLSTKELEEYVKKEMSDKLGGIDWRKSETYFEEGGKNSAQGMYIFQKNGEYHILFTEKGRVYEDRITKEKEDVLWAAVYDFALNVAIGPTTYKVFGKNSGESTFDIEMEICSLFGEKFEERLRREYEEMDKEMPSW